MHENRLELDPDPDPDPILNIGFETYFDSEPILLDLNLIPIKISESAYEEVNLIQKLVLFSL